MNLEFVALDDSRVAEAFGVLGIVGQWLESLGRRQRISKTTYDSYLQWQSEQANFVVTQEDKIIGLVTLRNEQLDDWPDHVRGPQLMLRALATHPDHQGKGVGGFAIRETIAGPGKGQLIFLDCVSDSLPDYYATFGFVPVARQIKTFEDGESFDITLMQFDAQAVGKDIIRT